jgi:hypothetical protein
MGCRSDLSDMMMKRKTRREFRLPYARSETRSYCCTGQTDVKIQKFSMGLHRPQNPVSPSSGAPCMRSQFSSDRSEQLLSPLVRREHTLVLFTDLVKLPIVGE